MMAPRWSDTELGLLADVSMTVQQIADALGRSYAAVASARARVRAGWIETNIAWTDDEDHFLLNSPWLTAEQIADHLHRPIAAVQSRRKKITSAHGIVTPSAKKGIGRTRTLVAKSCTGCGRILDPTWYFRTKNGPEAGRYSSKCKICKPKNLWGPYDRDSVERRAAGDKYLASMQAVTLPGASRTRYEWLESDHAILSRGDLHVVEKALLLHRTFFATRAALNQYHYPSRRVGEEIRGGEWFIRNDLVAHP